MKRIIKESTNLSVLKQYFDTTGTVTETANGISVDGDVEFKEGKRVKEIPIAFDKISGVFDMTNAGLENLNNFPHEVTGDIFLDNNKSLTSLATSHPVNCYGVVFSKVTGITDLTGFQISNIKSLMLTGSTDLQSLDGSAVGISRVVITRCPSFTADLSQYKNIGTIVFTPAIMSGIPLARILAFGSVRPVIHILKDSSTPSALWKIVDKYQGKGPENILHIMRDLRDAGFDSSARI